MVVRYALLAQALHRITGGGNVVPIACDDEGDPARGARDEGVVEGEVLKLPPLTSTRTKAPGERLELST